MRACLGFACSTLLGLGCGSYVLPPGDVAYMDEDFPAGGCRDTGSGTGACEHASTTTDVVADTTDSSSTTGSTPVECARTDDCGEGACAAPVEDVRGELRCVAGCIDTMDESLWCADAAACCDPRATCSVRGYCVVP